MTTTTNSNLPRSLPGLCVCVCVCAKELKDLQAAKQLLLQQKVDLQGRVEAIQASLEQEKKEHQKTHESITQSQQQHRAEADKLREQMVRTFIVGRRQEKYH